MEVCPMNQTQKRVYNFIKYLCSSCILHDQSGRQLDNMSVLLTRQAIANKLCLSERTVNRALDYLVANNYIYRISIGINYIYNINNISNINNTIIRVRLE